MGNFWYLSKKALKINQYYLILSSIRVCARQYRAGSRKQDFVLNWVLLGSGINPIIEYSNESYLKEGKNKGKLRLQFGRRQWSLTSGRKWDLDISVVCKRPWFCLCLDKIMEWTYFVSFITVTECPVSRQHPVRLIMFNGRRKWPCCESQASSYQHSGQASQPVPGQFPWSRTPIPFSP